jgi:hypothetical protein
MAKKKKDKKDGAQAEAVDSIRAAIERGLQMSAEGAQATRERTRDLVDEIASAAGRVRQSLEDMRVLDELRKLRNEIETLGARVTALERPGSSASSASGGAASAAKPAASRASRSPAKKATSARKSTSSRKSSSARSSSAKKPAARKSTAKKSTSTTRSRAKKATTKPSTSS